MSLGRNRLPVPERRPALPDRPEGGPWGRIWLLFVLGHLLAGLFLTVNIPADGRPPGTLSKAAILLVVAVPLAVLLAVGVGLWLARTRGWRAPSRLRTLLNGGLLFLLGSAAACGLVFLVWLGAARL